MSSHLYSFKKREQIAASTTAFYFDISGKNYNFKAGQYAKFTLVENGKDSDHRFFSIASPPSIKEYIMIASRTFESKFTEKLCTMPVGTTVKISEAQGEFILHEDENIPAVFIAGGIGVTPVKSITEEAIIRKLKHKIYLFYMNRTSSLTAFNGLFEKLANENPQFQYIPFIEDIYDRSWKREFGRIDENTIKKYVKDHTKAKYYSVGPPLMVDGIVTLLIKAGISHSNIITEKY